MENYKTDINLSEGKLVLKFNAVWCGVCKSMEPFMDKMNQEFPDIKIYNVDIDDYPELTQKFSVKMLPTLVYLENGNETNRTNGKILISALRKAFRDLQEK
jgi:thioredoxin 1